MIFYSHVNEDNRVERGLMDQKSYPNLFCIAGSGERVISLMGHPGLEQVYAVDTNPEAQYLLELKLAVLKYASIEQYLWFIGQKPGLDKDRYPFYESIRDTLPEHSRTYWTAQRRLINKGILNGGHFERFLSRIRPLLALSLGSGFFQCFEKPIAECENFPHKRWQLMKAIFSHRLAYQLSGNKDQAFVATDADNALIPQGLQAILDRNIIDKAFMFHLLFKGHLQSMPAKEQPPSLQPGLLKHIKNRLNSGEITIHYVEGDLLELWKQGRLTSEQPAFFSLSDLGSFVDFEYLKAFFNIVLRQPGRGHRFVLRSFLRHGLNDEQLNWLKHAFTNLNDCSEDEMTAMYKVWSFDYE